MRKLFSLSLLSSLTLISCSTILNNMPGTYVLEIQQGNIIDQAMINQLKPNMDKRQVLFIMGSPMLADTFHADHWNYVYTDKRKGEDRIEKKITLVFKEIKVEGQEKGAEHLVGIYGDIKPESVPLLNPSDDKIVDVPKRDQDDTLWGNVKGMFDFSDIKDSPPAKPQKTDQTSDANNLPL